MFRDGHRSHFATTMTCEMRLTTFSVHSTSSEALEWLNSPCWLRRNACLILTYPNMKAKKKIRHLHGGILPKELLAIGEGNPFELPVDSLRPVRSPFSARSVCSVRSAQASNRLPSRSDSVLAS